MPSISMLLQIGDRAVGIAAVAFVDHMDIRDLENARLDRLDFVAEPGRGHHDGGVRGLDDLDFVLADADRLDR